MPHIDDRPGDYAIAYDGVTKWFRLVRDDAARITGYREGLAAELAPQIRTSGFSYLSTDPRTDLPLSFEDWQDGAGWVTAPEGEGLTTRRYNYAQGLDLSWPNRVYMSPEQQTTTVLATAPVGLSETSQGIFATAGQYIYELGGTVWTLRRDTVTKTFTAGVTDYVESGGTTVLVAPAGASAYEYSADGVTWTASTTTINAFKFFAVRGNSSGAPVLWGVQNDNFGLRNATDPDGSGGAGAWSAATALGHSGETVNGFLIADDRMTVFKIEGIFDYDGTTAEAVWPGPRAMKRTGSGRQPFLWENGKVYVPYGDALLEYDPQAKADNRDSLTTVFPAVAGNAELNGQVTAIAGDENWLYIFVSNAAGNTYCLKSNGRKDARGKMAFHPFFYLGANACNAALVVGPGLPHATNPALIYGYGAAVRYVILPRGNLRPEDDANYRFEATDGTAVAYGSWMHKDAQAYTAFLNRCHTISENTTGGRAFLLQYEIDASGTATTAFTANTPGGQELDLSTEVEFNRVRWILTGYNASNTNSPRLLSICFHCTPNPPRRRVWQLDTTIGYETQQRGGGGPLLDTGRAATNFLFNARRQRVTFSDVDNQTWATRLLDIQGIGLRRGTNGVEKLYTVTLAEIAPSGSGANPDPFTLDEDAFDQKALG